MKHVLKSLMASAALASGLLLTACGGGGGLPDQPLSVEDGAPEAYTTAYLDAHPELLVQPEHLITALIKPGEPVRVRLHIREPMTLSMAIDAEQTVLSRVTVTDPSGTEVLAHQPGSDVAVATLQPGPHTIVMTPNARAADGQVHRVYLKLADTPQQAQRRLLARAPVPGLLDSQAPPTALGAVSSDGCVACSFNGAELANENFNSQVLTNATFDGSHVNMTQFIGAQCQRCEFTNLNLAAGSSAHPGGWGTTFQAANLQGATISAASPNLANEMWFSSANLSYATLAFTCQFCSFEADPETNVPTNLNYADLTNASLFTTNTSLFMNADFSYARVGTTTFNPGPNARNNNNPAFMNARFDNIQPANIFTGAYFKGFNLKGVSFANVDLSTADLSGAVNVTQADFSQAILSNGTSGASFAGVNFGSKFSAFAGTMSVTGSGKNLSYVNFSGANLYEANLTQVTMHSTKLQGANLNYANLYGADMTGAQLGAAQGSGQAPGSLTGAYMPLANLSDADLRSVSLSLAHVYGKGATFARALLASADFTGASLQEADFTSVIASDAVFGDTALVNATFSGARLDGAKFTGARLQGTDFSESTDLTAVQLDDSAVETTSGTWPFTELNSPPMSYAYNATQLGSLQTTAVSGAICPSGASAPCNTAAKLLPMKTGPYPSRIPGCNPVYKDPNYPNCTYCNCLAPAPPP